MKIGKRLARRGTRIAPPAVSAITQYAQELESQGHRLTYLVRGEPDFNTPEHISRAATHALVEGHTHYPPPRGIPELRQAVTERMIRDFELEFDPEKEVLITTGATLGNYLAVQAIVDPGDEVILFDPAYDPYEPAIRLAEGVPVRVPAQGTNGHFSVSASILEQAISPRTKAILINNPWNPTGTVMTPAELNTLVEMAKVHNLILITDEIYEKIIFDGREHQNLAALSSEAKRRTVTVNSFSKTYAMTGWRLGYNLAPAEICQRMLLIGQQFSRSASTFVQHAGVEALTGTQDASDEMVVAYAHRRDMVTRMLNEANIEGFSPPEGTFFVFLNVEQYEMTSREMTDYLLHKAGVVTIPGRVYGASGEGHIRFSFAYNESTIIQGVSAIIEGIQAL